MVDYINNIYVFNANGKIHNTIFNKKKHDFVILLPMHKIVNLLSITSLFLIYGI